MFQALKDALTSRRHSEEQSAAKRYEKLVEEAFNDKLAAGDVERVDKILRDCGRTLQNLEADVNALREQRRLEAIVATIPALEAKAKQLQTAHDKAVAEFEEWRIKRSHELVVMEHHASNAYSEMTRAHEARSELYQRFPACSGAVKSNLQSRMDTLQSQIGGAEITIREKRAAIAMIQAEAKRKPGSSSAHDGIRNNINRLTDDIAALEREIADWKAEIADLEREGKALAKSAA